MNINWKIFRVTSIRLIIHSMLIGFSFSVMANAAQIYKLPPELMAGVLAGSLYMFVYSTLFWAFDADLPFGTDDDK